jgi:hypothetical protein
VASILDTRNPPSRSRRFWYNQITAAEDAWIVPQDFDDCADRDLEVAPGDEIVLFFDGSKSDDATGLVGCRLSDGHVLTLGMWQKPPGERGKGWIVPKASVSERVARCSTATRWWRSGATRRIPVKDDESQERYWDDVRRLAPRILGTARAVGAAG